MRVLLIVLVIWRNDSIKAMKTWIGSRVFVEESFVTFVTASYHWRGSQSFYVAYFKGKSRDSDVNCYRPLILQRTEAFNSCLQPERERFQWSRGSVLAFGTQVRGFTPGRSSRIFRAKKILSTPSFGGEVKPSVPCRSSTACKRSPHVTWKTAFRQNYRTFLAHSSTFRRWVLSRGDTRGDAWWRNLERLTKIAQ